MESIERRAHSIRPGHIFPTRISGVSSRYLNCSNCQISIVSRTVPMPPGATTNASDVSTNWCRRVKKVRCSNGHAIAITTGRFEPREIVDNLPLSRTLTLRVADGETQTVYVAPEVKLFDELKTGDKVTVRVLESVIMAARPDLKPNVPVDTTAAAKKSGAAGGDVLQQLKAVVTIDSIDLRTQTVTYKGGNNQRVVRAVDDARLLDGLKAGDVIEITYTRQRAIEVERRR
jgi:Cu/Ag efflux protein CusF